MARRSSVEKNKQYLRKLAARFPEILPAMLADVSMRIYVKLMEVTVVDTGQALWNWNILPTKGQRSRFPRQAMLWGYGDVAPTAPVGVKTWGRHNKGNAGQLELIQAKLEYSASMFAYIRRNPSIVNVLIYNPITPGFAGFAPGSDAKYEETALGEARARSVQISEAARAETYREMRRQFPGLFR